jgi:hypothetical protein
MIKREAVTICYKDYLKPEEALIYTNLGRTRFAEKCAEYSIEKTPAGYYNREDLIRMMVEPAPIVVQQRAIDVRCRKRP